MSPGRKADCKKAAVLPQIERNSWQGIPNEMRLMIVRKMGLEASLAFARCGVLETSLTKKYTRSDAVISMKYLKYNNFNKVEMEIELRDPTNDNVALKWCITPIGRYGDECKLIQFDPAGAVLNVKLIRRIPLQTVAFQLVARLCADRMFNVKKLIFDSAKFNSHFHPGIRSKGLEEIVFLNCDETYDLMHKVASNYNFKSARILISKNGQLSQSNMRNDRYHNIMPIFASLDNLENSYLEAFPMGYEVTTFEDGRDRYTRFISKIPEYADPSLEDNYKKIINDKETVKLAMYLRAAYGSTPVQFLQANDPGYQMKITLLRDMTETVRTTHNGRVKHTGQLCKMPLLDGEVAMLTLRLLSNLGCFLYYWGRTISIGEDKQIGGRLSYKAMHRIQKNIESLIKTQQ